MTIGLDLGATQFRSLRHQGDRLVGRTCRAQILSIAATPAHRRLLDHDGVHYAESPGKLHILGDAAVEWGQLMSLEPTRLLIDGQLPAENPIARQILSLMVDAVLPRPKQPGDICLMTIPGELDPDAPSPEREFFTRLVRLRGYSPTVLGQGHALVLAELAAAGFSGLGISLGATLSEFSLNRSGREVARCAIPWGLDEIGDTLAMIGQEPTMPNARAEGMLADFLVELLLEAGSRIAQHDGFRVLQQPVTIAWGGGLAAMPRGGMICEQAWRRAGWPLRLAKHHLCPDAAYTIARGCLIAATLEAKPEGIAIAA